MIICQRCGQYIPDYTIGDFFTHHCPTRLITDRKPYMPFKEIPYEPVNPRPDLVLCLDKWCDQHNVEGCQHYTSNPKCLYYKKETNEKEN